VECPAPALVTRYLGSSVRFREVIWRAPETIQDKFFFSVLMESGLMLSGRAAREYSGAHFKFQRKPERQPQ
jgi:hypothetical protein